MKTKKFSKKLGLSKVTIADIGKKELNVVKGGITNTCISVFPEICTIGCPASFVAKTQCEWCVP